MNKQMALEVIKNAFFHMICEEDVQVGNVSVLLYFPTMGIAVLDMDSEKRKIMNYPNMEDIDDLMVKRELNVKTIYLDLEEADFNIGLVINDILMEAEFEPSPDFLMNRDE